MRSIHEWTASAGEESRFLAWPQRHGRFALGSGLPALRRRHASSSGKTPLETASALMRSTTRANSSWNRNVSRLSVSFATPPEDEIPVRDLVGTPRPGLGEVETGAYLWHGEIQSLQLSTNSLQIVLRIVDKNVDKCPRCAMVPISRHELGGAVLMQVFERPYRRGFWRWTFTPLHSAGLASATPSHISRVHT